jgi:hypothetical protein
MSNEKEMEVVGKKERKAVMRGASVSVRIPAESYAMLRKIQEDLSEKFGVNPSIPQTLSAVIFRYTHECA